MSTRFLNDNASSNTDTDSKVYGPRNFNAPAVTPWVRNPSWLPLPVVLSTDQKFVGLYAIYQGDGAGGTGGNFIALTAAGDYTVDWGDGSAPQNFLADVVANYAYSFSTAALTGTDAPVTFTDSTDTVDRANHGYSNGMSVCFYSIVTTTGILPNTPYFVINATTNTFQISTLAGGSAIVLTNNGSATLLSYKQAIVTVTPQSGQSLTVLNLHKKYNVLANLQTYNSGFLDIALASSVLNALMIGGTTPGGTAKLIYFTSLERVNLVKTNLQVMDAVFYLCSRLQVIEGLSLSTKPAATLAVSFTDVGDLVTAANHGLSNGNPVMLTSIVSTTGISIFTRYFVINATTNTFQISTTYGGLVITLTTNGSGTFATGNSMAQMFISCTSLQAVPLFNTAAVMNMNNMFSGCRSLRLVERFDTASVVNTAAMFVNCSALQEVPLFNTAAVLTMSGMFSGCASLENVPLFNTAAVTNMSSMFSNCSSLQEVPLFNTAAVTVMNSMLAFCASLQTVPLFNTAAVTNMSNMFQGSGSLQEVPLFNTAAVTNMSNMFSSCNSLETVPLFNTAAVINMTSMFANCLALKTVPLFNTAAVTSMSSMFSFCTSLRTVPLFNTAAVTAMSITFQDCISLETVPLFNTAAVTSMSSMFSGCNSLQAVPLFNTAAVTNMTSMFGFCTSLPSIPLFNTPAVTNMNGMFSSCLSLQAVPALITTAVINSANFSSMFSNCPSLTRIQAKNFRFSFSVAVCKLSGPALDEIYTNLPTATSQTITVTNNYGTTGDTPSIATAKGWTVTG